MIWRQNKKDCLYELGAVLLHVMNDYNGIFGWVKGQQTYAYLTSFCRSTKVEQYSTFTKLDSESINPTNQLNMVGRHQENVQDTGKMRI